MKVKVAHKVLLGLYAFGLFYDAYYNKPPFGLDAEKRHNESGGKYKYLTHLDMLLQCGYFALCVINDLVGTEARAPKEQGALQQFRDWLFSTLVFPLGLFVTFIFWVLYAIDRELIFPESLDEWFPSWLNHVMHTLPAIGVLIEVMMVCHCYCSGLKRFIPIISAYVLYLSWICYIAYAAGIWVYPVFEVLDLTGRTIFFAALLFPSLFCVQLGQKIHTAVWGTDTEQTIVSGKRD